MKQKILVVDDEAAIRGEVEEALQEAGFETRAAPDGKAAAEMALADSFDICISDIRMPQMGGVDLLKRLGETSPETAVILMTAYAELETALDALRYGATDYLLKPFKHEELLAKLARISEHRKLVLENRNLRRAVDTAATDGATRMIGQSAAMQSVLAMIDRVAGLPTRVLVTGESGTGKDLVARALHERGPRAKEPFVPINCAAIPETLLESELFGHVKGAFTGAVENKEGLLKTAGDGTIFLDELGEMPLPIQAKLLRALEQNEIQPVGSTRRVPIGARIVTATNKDLKAEAKAGRFREDLYFRIAVVEVQVPPLRERREDIPLLANHFVLKYARELGRDVRGISSAALGLLVGYDWRGNIRELSNAMERAVIFTAGPEIVPADLPEGFRAVTPRDPDGPLELDAATREFERAHIQKVIEQCGGNKRKAAKLLGIGATSLYRKIGDPTEEDIAGA